MTYLLPDGFHSRADYVAPQLKVAVIPDDLQDALVRGMESRTSADDDKDLALIQSQGFLQHLHASFLGVNGTNAASKLKHPIWELVIHSLPSPGCQLPKAPGGLSHTITEAVRELSTSFCNLWEGAIYTKSLDYLLRILLRLHLAPRREERTREQKRKMVERKQAQVSQRMASGKAARARWKAKGRLLFDDLSDLLESGNQELLLRRVPVLIGLIKDLNARQPTPGIQTHIPSLEVQLRSITTQQPLECNEGSATLSTESEMVQCEEDSDSDDDDDSVAGDLSGASPISLRGIHGTKT